MSSNFSKMVAGIREEQAAAKEAAKEELRQEGFTHDHANQYRRTELIDQQKRKFASAHTTNGVIYFNLIGKMIKSGEIKPPRGMDAEDLQSAYDQAVTMVAKKEFDKSAKKNRK